MKVITTLCSIAVLSTILAATVRASDLVHLEVHEASTGTGKPLDMRFDESARDDASSTVDVTFVSGASVPSAMFVMRGMCAVTRARDHASFLAERIDGSSSRYRVTFPTQQEGPTIDVPATATRLAHPMSAVVTLQQCALVGF